MRILFLILLASGCAFVHKHQVQDIDHRILKGKKFEFMMSEVGIEVSEGVRLVGVLNSSRAGNQAAQNLANIIALFQMGPRTGKPVYNEEFAKKLTAQLFQVCGKQEISGLTFLREMNNYPVVSGEIIKVSGYCI